MDKIFTRVVDTLMKKQLHITSAKEVKEELEALGFPDVPLERIRKKLKQ